MTSKYKNVLKYVKSNHEKSNNIQIERTQEYCIYEKDIQQELNLCEKVYITKIYGIIETWKIQLMKDYRDMVSKVDKTLFIEVNKIISEQINIEKEMITNKISEIGRLLGDKQNNKLKQRESQIKINDKTILMTTNKQKSTSFCKNRSISGELSRRKLSKGKVFAQAKKININQQYLSKTNNISIFHHEKEESKIKKNRRKDENYFDKLQKCYSNTSPSNFMFNYLNRQARLKQSNYRETKIVQENHDETINYQVQVNGKPINEAMTSQQKQNQMHQNMIANQTQTYHNLMMNFQQKMGKKLDDLMQRYTKIQQNIENNVGQKVQKAVERLSQSFQKQKQNKISIQSSLSSSHDYLANNIIGDNSIRPQKKMNVSLISPNETASQKRMIQNSNIKSQSIQVKKGNIKSVDLSNKIIKNKVNIQKFDNESIEQIPLSTKQISKKQLIDEVKIKKQIEDNSKFSIDKQLLNKDKIYFQNLILQFHSITQKIILPISKQLLYIIINNYEQYCNINDLEKNLSIIGIQNKKLIDFSKQYKNLLQKIQKVIDSKCQKSKKEKLINYFQKFIYIIASYDTQKKVIIKQQKKFNDQNQLKDKIRQIKSKFRL